MPGVSLWAAQVAVSMVVAAGAMAWGDSQQNVFPFGPQAFEFVVCTKTLWLVACVQGFCHETLCHFALAKVLQCGCPKHACAS